MRLHNIILIGLVLLTALIPTSAQTWGVVGLSATTPAVPDYCESCTDDADADILCETFESSQFCTWSILEDGGAAGDVTISTTKDDSPALGCGGNIGDNAISVVKTSEGWAAAWAYIDYTSITTAYMQFYIKILAEGFANGDSCAIVGYYVSSSTPAFGLQLVQDSDKLYFGLAYRDGGWKSDLGSTAISLDTWYGVRMYFNDAEAGSSCSWAVDYDLDGTYTDEGSSGTVNFDRVERYISIGCGYMSKTISFQVEGLKVDADAYPDDCAR